MKLAPAVAALIAAAALPLAASDLDEARRALDSGRPIWAIESAREVLAVEPRNAEAHRLLVGGLALLHRTIEAAPALEAWAAQTPGDPTPLRILLDVYGPAASASGLVSIRDRISIFPEPERGVILRDVTLGLLRAEAWSEAAATLARIPEPEGDAPADRMFRMLEVARQGEGDKLLDLLGSNPEVYEAADGDAVWWMERLLDRAPPRPGPGADEDEPALPKTGVVLPVVIEKVEPVYPDVARRAKIEGSVTVQAVILRSGRVAGTRILASSNPMFNDAARRAILRWRYEPALLEGRPVAIYYQVVVQFKLRKGKK